MNQLRQDVIIRLLLFLGVSLASGYSFPHDASLRKVCSLLESPQKSSTIISSIAAKKEVEVIRRQGLWVEIKVDDLSGWVKLTELRFNQSPSYRTSLTELKTGREGAGNTVVATGVRGLEAEAIQVAVPDYVAFLEFEKFSPDPDLEKELLSLKEPRRIANISYAKPAEEDKAKTDAPERKKRSSITLKTEIEDDF